MRHNVRSQPSTHVSHRNTDLAQLLGLREQELVLGLQHFAPLCGRIVLLLQLLHDMPISNIQLSCVLDTNRGHTHLRPVISSRAAERSCLEDGDEGVLTSCPFTEPSRLSFLRIVSNSAVRSLARARSSSTIARSSASSACVRLSDCCSCQTSQYHTRYTVN